MKTVKLFIALLLLGVSVAACEQEPETPKPSINLALFEVTLATSGESIEVAYEVANIAEGADTTLTVAEDAEWLSVSTEVANKLIISATENTSEEQRSADVVLSYAGAESVTLKVTQRTLADEQIEALSFNIIETGSSTITFSVYAPAETTWVPMITYAKYWDDTLSDEEIFASDLEYFIYLADSEEITLETFLSETVGTGSEQNIVIDDLDPSTEYVLYVYGISLDGELTTPIVSQKVTTQPPYDGDITFEFTAEENDFNLDFTVTPSHTGVSYYHGIATEAEIEAWKELAESDNLRDAIQVGDIEANINRLLDWEYIDERSDYFDMYNESDVMDWGWEELSASTKYIIYAAKWNENCELVGEVSTYEHTSASIEPSDNIVTAEITNISQSSITVETTTTNNDPYVIMPIRSSEIEGMTDAEIFSYITDAYDYLVGEYVFYGSASKTFRKMRPDHDYTLLTFGYYGGTQTTEMWKQTYKTLASGDPADCTFQITVMPDTDYAWVEITPSDQGHYYFWAAFPASSTADDVLSYVDFVIEDYYEGDIAAFASWELSQGVENTEVWDLTPATEYKIGLVILDYETAEPLSDVIFGEPFTTNEVTYADITINVAWDKYYDIDELIAAGYTQYEDGAGEALLPLTVTTEGDCVEYYYDIYGNDLSDTATYPDAIFYDGLWYGAWMPNSSFAVAYDKPSTIVAVAYDSGYNPCVIYREVIVLTKDGVSPVADYEASLSSAKLTKAAMPEVGVGVKKHDSKALTTQQIEAKVEAAAAKIVAERKAKVDKHIAVRAEHKAVECRAIAR